MKKFLSILLIICIGSAICLFAACSNAKDGERSSYDIFVIYDEVGQCLTGSVMFDYLNNTDNEVSDLKFNLYGNAFREDSAFSPVSGAYANRAYYNGKSYGSLEVTNVENCAGWDVSGEDENILVVNLLEPVYPDQRVKITISYTLSLAKINHRTGVAENCVNLGNFYPILCAYSREGFIECPYYAYGDPFISEVADYTVTVDAPENYIVAASGREESSTTVEGRRKTQYVLRNSRDFAIVMSDKFQVLSQEVDGVAVSYYYVSDDYAEESLAAACESLSYFNSTFGGYIYPTLAVVQTGFCYGGMEYPGLTMIADGQTKDGTIYTIVHENAHQWWYAMVGSDQLTAAWQDEGLAEYSTLLFFEDNPKYGYTRTGIVNEAKRTYRAFFTVMGQLNEEQNTGMSRNLSAYSSELEYSNVVYNKGLIMFDTLRDTLGKEKFISCLQEYFGTYCGKIASTDAIIAAFRASGTDVEGMFTSFIEGKTII